MRLLRHELTDDPQRVWVCAENRAVSHAQHSQWRGVATADTSPARWPLPRKAGRDVLDTGRAPPARRRSGPPRRDFQLCCAGIEFAVRGRPRPGSAGRRMQSSTNPMSRDHRRASCWGRLRPHTGGGARCSPSCAQADQTDSTSALMRLRVVLMSRMLRRVRSWPPKMPNTVSSRPGVIQNVSVTSVPSPAGARA